MKSTIQVLVPLAIGAALLAGCASEAPLADGSAVRALIQAQTHDPAASARNGVAAREGTDAERAVGAVGAMREGVTKPREEWHGVITTGGRASFGE